MKYHVENSMMAGIMQAWLHIHTNPNLPGTAAATAMLICLPFPLSVVLQGAEMRQHDIETLAGCR